MSKKTSPVIQAVAVTLSLVFFAGTAFFIHIMAPVSFGEKWKEVEIAEGATFSEAIDILAENGIIKNRFAFLLLGRITAAHKQLKPGYYNLSTSMSPLEVFNWLIEGRTIQYTVTIPEGSDLKKIRKIFKRTGIFDDTSWQLVYDRSFLDRRGVDAPSLEGYIYPDTYNFTKGTDPETVLKIMVQRMREQFNDTLMTRAEELGMSLNEVLTLASIIEKEAIYDYERPIISAVYHNRLRKNMRLQADPTVLYGVEKRWKRIRYRDLRRVTPYNTYLIKGLPPGPIASPGIKSIKAALYYKDVDYLYFVSMNNGRHHFSRTGKEHRKAVITFQRDGREFTRNAGKKEN